MISGFEVFSCRVFFFSSTRFVGRFGYLRENVYMDFGESIVCECSVWRIILSLS